MSYSVGSIRIRTRQFVDFTFDCVPIPKARCDTTGKLKLYAPRDLFHVEQLLDTGAVGDDTDLQVDAKRATQKLLQRI